MVSTDLQETGLTSGMSSRQRRGSRFHEADETRQPTTAADGGNTRSPHRYTTDRSRPPSRGRTASYPVHDDDDSDVEELPRQFDHDYTVIVDYEEEDDC